MAHKSKTPGGPARAGRGPTSTAKSSKTSPSRVKAGKGKPKGC